MNFNYWLGHSFSRLLFATCFRWRVYSPERVPSKGPAILAANHASFLDPLLIGAGVSRPLHYLARASLFRFPVLGAILRSVNTVPVERDRGGGAGLKAILERLLKGGAIVLFPEGTRSWDGGLRAAHPGIGLVVIKSAAPVVPVRVFGTFEAFGRNLKFPRPRPVAVKYGVPLDFQALRAEARAAPKARLKEIYARVAEEIMAAIAKLEPVEDQPAA